MPCCLYASLGATNTISRAKGTPLAWFAYHRCFDGSIASAFVWHHLGCVLYYCTRALVAHLHVIYSTATSLKKSDKKDSTAVPSGSISCSAALPDDAETGKLVAVWRSVDIPLFASARVSIMNQQVIFPAAESVTMSRPTQTFQPLPCSTTCQICCALLGYDSCFIYLGKLLSMPSTH